MRILVAVDNTEYAEVVLRRAIGEALKLNAELVVMSVAQKLLEVEKLVPEAEGRLVAQARALAERAAAKCLEKGVKTTVEVESGLSPAECIVRYAEKEGVDLIITGHRAKAGMERYRIGSVAVKVVTYAPCSVLVVRDRI